MEMVMNAFTYDGLFELKLKQIINEEMAVLSDGVASGTAHDYAEYKFRVGKIQGLKMALEYCDTAKTDLAKR